jgi:hypothetical protein
VVVGVAVIGLLVPGIFRDPAVMAGSARGVGVASLAFALPALLGAMVRVARGSRLASLVWLGALGDLLYWSVYFAFGAAFNRLFLAYVAMFGLALWALAALLASGGLAAVRGNDAGRWPGRLVALFLLYPTVLPTLASLRLILAAMAAGTVPASVVGTQLPADPFQVLGLAVVGPLGVGAAIGLWRGRAWGDALAVAFLTYWALATASIAADQWFAHRADPASPLASPAGTPLFAAQALVTLVVLIGFARYLDRRSASSCGRLSVQ